MLQLLLAKLLFDVQAERDRTLVLLTVLCMVTTQSNKLLAHRAATIGFALAALGVLHHSLHLLAGRQRAVGIATLASMYQGLNASLNT